MPYLSFIYALEPRHLLSASAPTLSADLSDALSEIRVFRGILTAARSTEVADRKTFLADLRPASSRASAKLEAQLEGDDVRGWNKTFAANSALLLNGSALCRHATADGILLLKRPSNPALNTRVSTEASALGGQIASFLAAVQNQFVAADQTHESDLNAIVSANPSLTNLADDLEATEGHLGGASGELSGTIALAQNQVNTLANDLATVGS